MPERLPHPRENKEGQRMSAPIPVAPGLLIQGSRDELRILSKYERIVIYLFCALTTGMTATDLARLGTQLDFDQEDVRMAMRAAAADGVIDAEMANPPDIKYTFDARRQLPPEIEQCGPMTWLQ